MRKKLMLLKSPIKGYYSKSKFLTLTLRHLYWMLLSSVCLALIYFLFIGDVFSIKSISCQYDHQVCSDELFGDVNGSLGQSIMVFKPHELEEKIKKNHPWVLRVIVKPIPPNKLDVQIKTREALAGIKSSDENKIFMVDEFGYIFADQSQREVDIPTISIKSEDQFVIGDKISNQRILNAIELVKLFKNYYMVFGNLEILSDRLTMKINDKLTVLFSAAQDNTMYQKKVTSLQQILSQVTIESKPILIDLRFEKPIVMEE